ncbi:MAG TPA: NHL repeat-containing protein [Bryobacteraceae bacterium]
MAVLFAGAFVPAARADIFVSHGAGDVDSGIVSSFSQYTGAPKLSFTGGLVWGVGVAFGPDENLYVADQSNGSVLRYNPSTGALIGTFTAPFSPSAPFAITFGPDGNLYMADNFGFIRRYNGSTGALLGVFSCAPPSGGNCYPFGLTFGPDGNLYVSESGNRTVLKFNGSTLAFMSVFVAPIGGGFPDDLHFGAKGNLYVDFSMPIPNTLNYYNDIFEFNGTTGTQLSYSVPGIAASAFAFGPDGNIYVAGYSGFIRISPTTGAFLGTFGAADPFADVGFITFGNPTLSVPPYLLYDPVTVTPLQKLRLTVVDGPVPVPPGVPVEATLGFMTKAGAPVGPTKVVSLNPGQAAFLDLEVSKLISSGRIEIQPTVTAGPGAPLGGSLQGSVEVFTASNGVGSAFYPGIPIPPTSNVTGPPSFVPQGVIYGQSIQINALAPPDSPCVALLSFADVNGNPIGPTLNANLSPGTMTSLTFNPNSITQSAGRQEYVPQIAPSNVNPAGATGIASACLASAEVINQPSSAVATYQISSPPIGTAGPAPAN